VVGRGPVCTGVTAILPRPKAELATPAFAGLFSANGDGEMTGSHIIEELGAFNFSITINQHPFLRPHPRRDAAPAEQRIVVSNESRSRSLSRFLEKVE
jgi:hypothetical protein